MEALLLVDDSVEAASTAATAEAPLVSALPPPPSSAVEDEGFRSGIDAEALTLPAATMFVLLLLRERPAFAAFDPVQEQRALAPCPTERIRRGRAGEEKGRERERKKYKPNSPIDS